MSVGLSFQSLPASADVVAIASGVVDVARSRRSRQHAGTGPQRSSARSAIVCRHVCLLSASHLHVEQRRKGRQSRLRRRLRTLIEIVIIIHLAFSCRRFADIGAFVFASWSPSSSPSSRSMSVSLGSDCVLLTCREGHLSKESCVYSPRTVFWHNNGLQDLRAALEKCMHMIRMRRATRTHTNLQCPPASTSTTPCCCLSRPRWGRPPGELSSRTAIHNVSAQSCRQLTLHRASPRT